MSDMRFPNPVRVVHQQSNELVIASAWDAVEFLRGWPENCAVRAYRIALQHCLDAVDGLLSVKKAHASFTAAVREAGMMALGPDQPRS